MDKKDIEFNEFLKRNKITKIICCDCKKNNATHCDLDGDMYCLDCLKSDWEMRV